MSFNELTLSEKLAVAAAKFNEKEFAEWLHGQVVGLAEYMQEIGVEQPYETAKKYVFDKLAEATNG